MKAAELKFRAWIKAEKEMIVVEKIFFDGYGGFEISSGDYEALDHLEVELMQFTGLLDDNKKKIYEGDIVKDKNGRIYRIEFNEGGFRYLGHSNTLLFTNNTLGCCVVGNIFADVELEKSCF